MTKTDDQKRDAVLSRMLATPPAHKSGQQKGGKDKSRPPKKKAK